jgi:hypothetical protein
MAKREFRSDLEIYGTPKRYRGGALHDMADIDQVTDVNTLPGAATMDGTEKFPFYQAGSMVQMSGRDLLTSPTDYRFGQQGGRIVGHSDFNQAVIATVDNTALGEDYCVTLGGAASGTSKPNDAGEVLGGHQVFGLIGISTGTAATGRCAISASQGGFSVSTWDLSKVYKMLARLRILNLSDGTNTFVVRVGLNDVNTGAAVGNGLWVEANTNANWRCRSVGGTAADLDSGIAVSAASYVNVGIIYDGAIGHFYMSTGVNPMTEVAQVTTPNLPAATTQVLPIINIVKSLGPAARVVNIDYLGHNLAVVINRGLTLRI